MTCSSKLASLGDVCDIIGGGTPAKDRAEFYGGNIPWATVRDMRSELIANTEFKITPLAVKSSSTNVIPKGNVVIATRVGLGKVCLLQQDTAINQDLRAIIPKNTKQLSVPFLFWWLKSVAHMIEAEGTGATVQGVKLPFVKSLPIPLPPLAEQQRIVAILDETFAGLATATANTKKNLKNARELFESCLNSVFVGDERARVATLGEVCSISSSLVDPREPQFIDLPHLGAGNMASKTGKLSDIRTAREEGLKSGKFLFDSTMVLYSKIRPYLMKACRPNFEGLCSADVYPLSPNSGQLDRNFLFHLLMSKDFTDFAISGSDRAGMPKVNRDHLFKYSFNLPSIEKQEVLARKLDEISGESNQLVAFYERRLADLVTLKQSILRKAFSGELTSQQLVAPTKPRTSIVGISATDLHAGIIAIAYHRHQGHLKQNTFGHVKAEKIVHMVEARVGIDLGRNPVKDAAGPNDYPHLMKVEHRANMAGYFSVTRLEHGPYVFNKKNKFDEIVQKTRAALGEYNRKVDSVIDMMLPMDTEQAEILATIFAAWNNLLLDGRSVEDETIVQEARENWHPDKLKIDRERFFSALKWMREHDVVPKGGGRKVVERTKE